MAEKNLPARDDRVRQVEEEVRKQVEALKGFYTHLGIFGIVMALLFVINLITSPEYLWAVWPLLGWGVGVGAHAVATFGLFGLGSQAWEERKVRELMQQRRHGLDAAEVRQLLHDELHDTPPDWERLRRRLENLEAIVTSREWEVLERRPEAPSLPIPDPEAPDAAARAERLARRMR